MVFVRNPVIDENVAKYINIGLITLIFLHFAAYFAAREIFLLAGINGGEQTRLANMVSGAIITVFLTALVIFIFRKYFKNHLSFKGSWGEKLVGLIIILHIFLGFAAIGATAGFEDKTLKSVVYAKYFAGLFSFEENPAGHLENLSWITLSHLLLGYSLLAVLPFTKVIDMTMQIPLRWRRGGRHGRTG
ncbi:MAG: respiratory nitrate reductase subunit gamma [Alphaproteobacteria bacterium]|jgi:nitrate reductase gamma subunit|nr:respiratory nitrate reductase subunit gamma [Alphaproteobacteria bacterium]